jgi:hypothetical protein
MKIRNEIDKQIHQPKSPRISQEDFQKGAGKAHMMKKMKEIKDQERNIVLSQIQSVRSLFVYDTSKDSKLSILENAINLVDKNKSNFGKTKNMSSLEKNRLALNMLSNLK